MNRLELKLDKKSESFYHTLIKQLIYKFISEKNYNVVESSTERVFNHRRADVYFKLRNGQRVAVEVQHSKISTREVIQRTKDYNRQGIFVLWVLHGKGKCVSSSKFPEHKKNVKISPVERFLHKMYGGRVYYVNINRSKERMTITTPFAVHYSQPSNRKNKLYRKGYDRYYFRNANFTFIPNWNLLCTSFSNFKIARYYDKNIKMALKDRILRFIREYIAKNPEDYKKHKKVKRLIKATIRQFKDHYEKTIIIECFDLISKDNLWLKPKL